MLSARKLNELCQLGQIGVEQLASQDPRAGMQITLMDLKNRVPENTHNDLLQIWVEQGSLGWLAFSLAMVALFVRLWGQLESRHLSTQAYILWAGFSAAVICILVNSSFSFPLHTPARATLFWLLVTMLSSFAKRTGDRQGG